MWLWAEGQCYQVLLGSTSEHWCSITLELCMTTMMEHCINWLNRGGRNLFCQLNKSMIRWLDLESYTILPLQETALSGTDHRTKCRPQSKVQTSLMGNQAVQCQAQQTRISKAKQVAVQKPGTGSSRYSWFRCAKVPEGLSRDVVEVNAKVGNINTKGKRETGRA